MLAAFVAGLVFSEGVPEALREPIHVVHRSITKVALTAVFLAFGTSSPSTPRGRSSAPVASCSRCGPSFFAACPLSFPPSA